MSNKRSILLGLFFLITLAVLGYYTLFLTDFTLFGKQSELTVHFSKTRGLREGDSVLVAGMRWGKVKELKFDPKAPDDRRITVTTGLNEPLVLREGFKIMIEDATVLGGRNLSIDPGPAGAQEIPPGTMLFGDVAANPLDALGDLVRNSEKGVTAIVEDLRVLAQGMREGRGAVGKILTDEALAKDLSSSVTSLAQVLANLEVISNDLRGGKGTAGQLLVNAELFDDLSAASRKFSNMLEETTSMVADMRKGNGVIGRMLTDPKLADDLSEAVGTMRSIVDRIQRGEGTLGLLISDDTIARDIATITSKVANGEGTLGALLSKADVYENLRSASENIDVMTSALRNGQGTLGRVIMDPELYYQIKTAMQIVQRSLEEYREAAPVTTFTSVFFGAF